MAYSIISNNDSKNYFIYLLQSLEKYQNYKFIKLTENIDNFIDTFTPLNSKIKEDIYEFSFDDILPHLNELSLELTNKSLNLTTIKNNLNNHQLLFNDKSNSFGLNIISSYKKFKDFLIEMLKNNKKDFLISEYLNLKDDNIFYVDVKTNDEFSLNSNYIVLIPHNYNQTYSVDEIELKSEKIIFDYIDNNEINKSESIYIDKDYKDNHTYIIYNQELFKSKKGNNLLLDFLNKNSI